MNGSDSKVRRNRVPGAEPTRSCAQPSVVFGELQTTLTPARGAFLLGSLVACFSFDCALPDYLSHPVTNVSLDYIQCHRYNMH